MSTKYKVLLVVLGFALSFAAGRYATPDKIKIKTVKEVETVVKTVTKVEVKWKTRVVEKEATNKKTTTTITEYPDGRKVTETVVVDLSVKETVSDKDASSNKDSVVDSSTVSKEENTKTVTRNRPSWSVTAYGLMDVRDFRGSSGNFLGGPVVVGATLQRRILGPIHIGIFGASDMTFGLGVGLEF